MTRPAVHAAAEQVYRLLPDFMRSADELEAIDYTALRYVAGASVGLEKAADFLTIVDPDTSVTGTCELVNADACPRPYLGWLGWLVGINTSEVPAASTRDVIREATAFQRRGSVSAIAAAVRRTLTGSKDVVVLTKPPDSDTPSWDYAETGITYDDDVRRYDGNLTDPYLIIIVTKATQTPDATATLLAALGEKPAGLELDIQSLSGMTYTELAAAYPTYDLMRSTNRTYDDLASSFA